METRAPYRREPRAKEDPSVPTAYEATFNGGPWDGMTKLWPAEEDGSPVLYIGAKLAIHRSDLSLMHQYALFLWTMDGGLIYQYAGAILVMPPREGWH